MELEEERRKEEEQRKMGKFSKKLSGRRNEIYSFLKDTFCIFFCL